MIHSAYIHIPFCEHICHYCDFNKVFINKQPVTEYLEALRTEIKTTLAQHPTQTIRTIFIGGGTPTALEPKQLVLLMEIIRETLFPFVAEHKVEFTVEANPNCSKEKLQIMHAYGVNRLSIGVQAFQEHLLQALGRTHTAEDIYEMIAAAKQIGFQNINIDLMYGLPNQTMEDFRHSLQLALQLPIQHISSYSLQIEPKTVFYQLARKGQLALPPEELEAQMLATLIDALTTSGFHHYEVSNFALPTFESKHNLTYWDNEEYYGFGAGAHSYVNGVRKGNIGPVTKYLKSIAKNGQATYEAHKVTTVEKMEEFMFLGLRKLTGISKAEFRKQFQTDIAEIFSRQIEQNKAKGFLEETGDIIRLTKTGLFLGNEVFQSFLLS